MGLHGISENSLIDLAIEQAERINKVTDPDSDPVQVWLTPTGTLTISIPNEYHELDEFGSDNIRTAKMSSLEDDRKIQECHFCHQKALFRQDDTERDWHCMNCGNTENLKMIPDSTPSPRSLPYEGGKQIFEQSQKEIKTAQSPQQGIIDQQKRQKMLKTKQRQQDIEESANALAIDE